MDKVDKSFQHSEYLLLIEARAIAVPDIDQPPAAHSPELFNKH